VVSQVVDESKLWTPVELPLNRWNRFASNEIDAVHQHMVRAFCPHDLATEGGLPPMTFRHNQATLRSSTFNATDYGLPYGRVAVSIPPAEHCFLVQFVLSGRAQFTHQGRTFVLKPGYMSVLSPHEPIRQVTDAGCRHFTVKLDKPQLEALLHGDFGHRTRPLVFSPDPVSIAGLAASFAQFVRTVVEDIDDGISGFMHPRAIGSTEEMLGRLLLSSVPHNYSLDYEMEPHNVATPYYVRRAEELIRTSYKEQLTLSDLISASGVSGRSLHFGFRRFRDDSPMGYLKRYRLERARQMLKELRSGELTVTEVALATGFLHPSKFSQDYAKRFGELPSVTLRKSQGA
jgi:AraC-like DNA-binding protein